MGVEHQKSIKMQVFHPWTLKFFKICFDILQDASEHHRPQFVVTVAVTPVLVVEVLFGTWT